MRIFSTPGELAEKFAGELARLINDSATKKGKFNIALSGGSTPELLFSVLAAGYGSKVRWQDVHFFWGDERCVDPADPESNFGMTFEKLLSKIDLPQENIHRIRGENDPKEEALRYSGEIASNTISRDDFPVFDLILLGLGEDGHTASIFPGHPELLESDKICDIANHPVTNQKRITITGRVINNAEAIVFLVTGSKKAKVVKKILKNKHPVQNYPASFVVPVYGTLTWFMDQEAGGLL